MFKLRILEISIDGENYSDINVTFAEQIEDLEGSLYDLQSIISQASAISSSYDATMLQAKQGKKANSTFNDMSDTGIDASEYSFVNNSNQELTINSSGIIARKMNDIGVYDDKQLKITSNGIYMTNDNWATIKEAIGEVVLDNGNISYGIVADNVIGKFILGSNIKISNSESSVVIDGSSIKLGDVAKGESPKGISLSYDGSLTCHSSWTGSQGTETDTTPNDDDYTSSCIFDPYNGFIIRGTRKIYEGPEHREKTYTYEYNFNVDFSKNKTISFKYYD